MHHYINGCVCLVFDIDDTIYENKTTQIIYDTIQQDYELYQLMKHLLNLF